MSGVVQYVHISRGVNVRYLVYTRARGHRIWHRLGKFFRSKDAACKSAASELARCTHLKRAMVCWMADYYDPEPIITMERRS